VDICKDRWVDATQLQQIGVNKILGKGIGCPDGSADKEEGIARAQLG